MKYIIILILISFLLSNCFSQEIYNDSLSVKPPVKSPWAMKFELGALLHQKLNQDFINKRLAYAGGITLSYKQFFLRADAYSVEFRPKKEIYFGNRLFDKSSTFTSLNLNSSIGYINNFSNTWSSGFWIGINISEISLLNLDDKYEDYSSNFISGGIVGASLEKYIKLKNYKYLIFSLGIAYYSTNYKLLSRDLSRSSLNYSLSVGYKFWFKRR